MLLHQPYFQADKAAGLRRLGLLIRFTLFCWLALPTLSLSATERPQQFIIRTWTTENGAPTNRINDLTTSADGFLWLATYEGLVRFDGHQFQVYNHQNHPALLGGLLNVFESQPGTLWMLSTSGFLIRLQGGIFTAWGPDDGFPSDAGLNLCADPSGHIVFSGADGFFTIGADARIQRMDTAVFPHEPLRDFDITADGTLWIAPRSGGLYSIKDATLRQWQPEANGASGNRVNSIVPLADGSLLLGVQGGTAHLQPQSDHWQFLAEPSFDRQDRTLQIARTPSVGVRLLGNSLGNLFQLDSSRTLRHLPLGVHGDFNETVNAISTLREGGFALGTYNSGLVLLTPASFPFFNPQTGLDGTLVNAITKVDESEWLIAHDRGVHVFDGAASFTPLQVNGAAFERYAVSTFIDSQRRIWIATMGEGTFFKEDGRWHVLDRDSGLATNTVRCFAEDSQGNIWIGTRVGLYKWNDGVVEVFNQDNGLRGNYILSLFIDAQDTVYVGMARTGLQKIVEGAVLPVHGRDDANTYDSRTIFSIREDHTGAIWCGMTGGVIHISNAGVRHIPLFEHFNVDSVYHVIDDHNGFLWLSSSNGIHQVPYATLANQIPQGQRIDDLVRSFDMQDGLPTNTMRAVGTPLLDARQRIWMPTENGFVIIDPRHIPTTAFAPQPWFDRISVNDQAVRGDWHFDLAELAIAPSVRRLFFEFTAPSFNNFGSALFRFRLSGFDEQWRSTTSRFAEYTNLPPGDYVFEVQAADGDQQWNPDSAKAFLSIAPRFTESAWFLPLLLGLSLTLAIALHFYRNRVLRAQQARLSQLVEERTEEIRRNEQALDRSNKRLQTLSDDMASFLGIAAHDLRNPLSNIEGLARFMQDELDALPSPELRDCNAEILTSVRQMRELLGNLLDLNRIEAGQTPANVAPLLASQALGDTIAHFRKVAAAKSITLAFEVGDPEPALRADAELLRQVLDNLLSNAIKFSMPDTSITCRVFSTPRQRVAIEVADQGPGIPSAEHAHVFKKFARLSPRPTQNETSTGLGLSIIKLLTELMQGEITFTSTVGKGTTFRLEFPSA